MDLFPSAGWTALHHAANYIHPKIVKLLLEAGARTDLTNHAGQTALDMARRTNNKEILKLLEEAIEKSKTKDP